MGEGDVSVDINLVLNKAIKSIDKLDQKFDKFEKNTKKSVKGAEGALDTFKGALAAIGVSKALGAFNQTLKRTANALFDTFVVQGITEAKNLENALIGLSSVANALGEDVSQMKQAAIDLSADGMIPLEQVAGSLKSLLASGLDGDKAIEVFKALRDSASFNRQGQLQLGEAIQGAADGIKNQNSIMVDNAGITKNISILVKEYAKSVGKTVAQLSDLEKKQAIANGVIKEAKLFQGDYNKSLVTFSAAQSAARTGIQRIQVATGKLFTQNTGMVKAIQFGTQVFKKWEKQIEQNSGSIRKFINDGIVKFIDALGPAIDTVNFFASAFKVAFNTVTIIGRTAVGALIGIANDLARTVSGVMSFLGQDTSGIDAFINSSKEAFDELTAEIVTDVKDIGDALGGSEAIELFKARALEAGAAVAAGFKEGSAEIATGSLLPPPENEAAAAEKIKGSIWSVLFAFDTAEELKTKTAKEQQKIRAANFKSSLGIIASLASSGNKILAGIGKAAAISTATIDGIVAVQKALASAPPPFNFILAGLVGTATAVNVAKIAGVKGFAQGGLVGGTSDSGDNVPIRVNSKESVLTLDQQTDLFNFIAGGAQGGGGGKVVINNPILLNDGMIDTLINAISNRVQHENQTLFASNLA